MKKSRSSVPLFAESCPPGPAPPVRYEGLFAIAGRPEPVPVPPLADPFVAIAVGKTKEGESLPAKPVSRVNRIIQRQASVIEYHRPSFEKPVPLRTRMLVGSYDTSVKRRLKSHLREIHILVHDNGRRLSGHPDLTRRRLYRG